MHPYLKASKRMDSRVTGLLRGQESHELIILCLNCLVQGSDIQQWQDWS